MSRSSLLAVVVAISACGVGTGADQPATLGSELFVGTKIYEPQDARACRLVSVRPQATGTVRSAPNVGMLEVAPVGSAVQSMFFDTAALGPETRHGVVEFALPALGGRVTHAALRFWDTHGWQLQPVPADVHTLSLYGDVDGVISTADFIREGDPFATFTTDFNDPRPVQREVDVSGHAALGGSLGVRIELDRTASGGSYGSGFDGFSVDLTICDEAALPHGAPIGRPK